MARYPRTQAAKKIIADLEERIAALRVEAAEHHEAGAHAMGSTTMVYADAYQMILNGLPADLAYVEAQAVEPVSLPMTEAELRYAYGDR